MRKEPRSMGRWYLKQYKFYLGGGEGKSFDGAIGRRGDDAPLLCVLSVFA